MPSTISAGTTAGTALSLTSDTSGELQIRTNNGATTAMTLTTGGNVGIGTSSPSTKLDVRGNELKIYDSATSNVNLSLRNSTTGDAAGFGLQQDGVNTILYNGSNGLMSFYTNAAERMRIDSAGRVTTPSQPAFVAKGIPSNVTSGVVLFGSSSIPLNVGSSYSQATGRFTAPIAGNYLITVVGMAQTNFYTSSVRVNASEFAQFRTNDGSVGAFMQGTISLIIPLAASDYVDLSIGSGTFGGNAQEVIFSGYLLG